MSRRRDIVDIDGIRTDPTPIAQPTRPFLSIWYHCCHVYGRLYRNHAHCAYEGRCPKCGTQARVGIGPEGTTARVFTAS